MDNNDYKRGLSTLNIHSAESVIDEGIRSNGGAGFTRTIRAVDIAGNEIELVLFANDAHRLQLVQEAK